MKMQCIKRFALPLSNHLNQQSALKLVVRKRYATIKGPSRGILGVGVALKSRHLFYLLSIKICLFNITLF